MITRCPKVRVHLVVSDVDMGMLGNSFLLLRFSLSLLVDCFQDRFQTETLLLMDAERYLSTHYPLLKLF